jgi:hypothetical protein
MKILTATAQGADREDDFCNAIEGEIVVPAMVCDSPNCGCDRSFSGLNSHTATTTLMVREVDLTIDDLEEAAIGWAEAGGWAKLITENPEPDDGPEPVRAFARDLVQDSADFAADYAEGTILHVRYDRADESWTFE